MTVTREQLELAAKASGLGIEWGFNDSTMTIGVRRGVCTNWVPLTDHGQLLDLAMVCGMVIDFEYGRVAIDFADFTGIDGEFTPGDFPSLAEAVITAAAEQQLAKPGSGAPRDSTGCENMGGERVCKEK